MHVVPSVMVAVGYIRSVVVLAGVIVPDPSVTVEAPSAGTIGKALAAAGASVQSGAALMSITASGPGSSVVSVVTAPVSGTLASVDVIAGQSVAIGMVLASITPDSFEAVAAVDPSLLYRFYGGPPSQVLVQIEKGPAPFACTFLSLGFPPGGPASAGAEASQPVDLECAIPTSQKVFSGVRCLLAATTASAAHALLIPITAVEGSANTGYVTLLRRSGHSTTQFVRLGITNGVDIQIVSGLKAGQRIAAAPPSVFPSSLGAGTG